MSRTVPEPKTRLRGSPAISYYVGHDIDRIRDEQRASGATFCRFGTIVFYEVDGGNWRASRRDCPGFCRTGGNDHEVRAADDLHVVRALNRSAGVN